eukprot:Gb_28641 [translate_table: standard]
MLAPWGVTTRVNPIDFSGSSPTQRSPFGAVGVEIPKPRTPTTASNKVSGGRKTFLYQSSLLLVGHFSFHSFGCEALHQPSFNLPLGPHLLLGDFQCGISSYPFQTSEYPNDLYTLQYPTLLNSSFGAAALQISRHCRWVHHLIHPNLQTLEPRSLSFLLSPSTWPSLGPSFVYAAITRPFPLLTAWPSTLAFSPSSLFFFLHYWAYSIKMSYRSTITLPHRRLRQNGGMHVHQRF